MCAACLTCSNTAKPMVGQDVHTTLNVAISDDVYSGWAENPDTAAKRMFGRQ